MSEKTPSASTKLPNKADTSFSASASSSSSSSSITVRINGQPITVPRGTIVAAAIALAGIVGFRSSVHGEPRGPLCGMGICMECRATINGRMLCRTCLIPCEPNMEIETDCDTTLTFANAGSDTARRPSDNQT